LLIPQGNRDALIAKFSSTGELLAIAYVGGSGDDEFHDIAIRNNRIIAVGSSSSDDVLAIADGNSTTDFLDNADGVSDSWRDALLVEFDTNCREKWRTFPGTERGHDVFHAVAINSNGDIYAVGASNGGFPVQKSSNQQSFLQSQSTNDRDILVTKFSSNRQLLWATYYGGNSDDSLDPCLGETAEDVIIDRRNHVYVVGWTTTSKTPLQFFLSVVSKQHYY
jgi:hypothetical protein